VVGVGRGFAAEADLDLARTLAVKLGAELACSRPIAEGVDWMPAERYLGVSGATIKPDLYLAVGISGQVQHLVGVNGAKVIVAVNKDKNAPIFASADFGVVGDLYQVLPELAKNL
jgi:electron transfer flavoprotein alpha subunit